MGGLPKGRQGRNALTLSAGPVGEVVPIRGPVLLYLSSLAPGSRPTMAGAARDIARFFGSDSPEHFEWWRLRYPEIQALRSDLAARYSPATANRYLSCLRGILRQCFRNDQIPEHDYQRAIGIEPVRGSRDLPGRALSAGELRALFAACDGHPLGARNAAMLALLYGGGLRRAEVVALDLEDYAPPTLTVRRGKGNKSRMVYLSDPAVRAVEAWLDWRGRAEPGPLLYPTIGGKPGLMGLHKRRMNPGSIRHALRGIAKRAGVEIFSPHDVRRTFVGDLLDAGMDLATVQQLAGHSQPTTTARYDRRPERARSRAKDLLHVPYTR